MTSASRFSLFLVLAFGLLLQACGPDQSDTPDARNETRSPADEQNEALRAAFEAADWPHEASDLPADDDVRYGVLDNGMRYAILVNDTPTDAAALRLIFDAGSLAEADHQRGLAHFIEHMAFNGTTNVPEGEMVPLLERYGLAFGPDTNAFTGRDVVGYQLALPSTDDQIVETGLFLLRETASEMTFDPEAIDRERGIVLSEERFRNTPVRRFFNAYYEFLYPETLIAERDAIGTTDVIETAQAEAFADYYDNYYTPERALLVVAGDVDPDAIEAKIRDGFDYSVPGLDVDHVASFASWEQPDDARGDSDIGIVPPVTDASFGYFYDPEVFTLISVDVIEPGAGDLDTIANRQRALRVRLGNAIVQRRLQSLINSGNSPLVQANLSYTSDFDLARRANLLAVSSPENWAEGLGVVEQELRRALEHGFTQAELNEQMANLHTALRDSAEQAGTRDSASLADSFWQAWQSGDVFTTPAYDLQWFEAYRGDITVEAVEAAFRDVWTQSPPQVYVAANQEVDAPEETVRQAWQASAGAEVEPPAETGDMAFAYTEFGEPGEVVSRDRIEDIGVDQLIFDNGVRLNVKTTDFEDNAIRVRVEFGAGDLTPQPVPAAGTILGAVFGGAGLEAHSRDELQRILAGRSVGYGLNVSEDSFVFSETTTPTDFELQMQVMTAFMTAPGWRADGLNQFRAIAEEIRRGMNAQAVQVATNRVARMLRSGDPRWGFPTESEIAGFSMEAGREFLSPALESAPVEITVVGDITTEEVVSVIARTFGALPERESDWPAYDENRDVEFPAATETPEIVRFNGQDYQAMANVYWPTDDGMDIRRARVLTLMRAVYDLKATDRFREQEGATYSAIVSSTQSDVFEDYGYLWVGLDVESREIDRMYEIADELAAELAAGDISEDEMLRARQPILESIEEARETNPWWLRVLSRAQREPDRLDEIRSMMEDYRTIGADEIAEAAARYLQPDRAFRVTILPRSGESAGDRPEGAGR